jgi:hypothetical protein
MGWGVKLLMESWIYAPVTGAECILVYGRYAVAINGCDFTGVPPHHCSRNNRGGREGESRPKLRVV